MGEEKMTIPPGIKMVYINATEEEEEEMLRDFCADGDIVEIEPSDIFEGLDNVQEVIEEASYIEENVYTNSGKVPFRTIHSPEILKEEDSETWYEKNQQRLKKRSGSAASSKLESLKESKGFGTGLIIGGVIAAVVLILIIIMVL